MNINKMYTIYNNNLKSGKIKLSICSNIMDNTLHYIQELFLNNQNITLTSILDKNNLSLDKFEVTKGNYFCSQTVTMERVNNQWTNKNNNFIFISQQDLYLEEQLLFLLPYIYKKYDGKIPVFCKNFSSYKYISFKQLNENTYQCINPNNSIYIYKDNILLSYTDNLQKNRIL